MTNFSAGDIQGIGGLGQVVAVVGGGTGGPPPTMTIVIWVAILITALVCGGFAVMVLRRNLLSKDGPSESGGMTLDQLRGMHRRGELSQDEYEIARAALTSSITGKPPPPAAPRPAPERRTRTAPAPDGALVAPPGFDLTGQPLPTPPAPKGHPGAPGPR